MPIVYDDRYIIRPGVPKQLTNEQVSELLECANDVKYFAKKYYTIVHAVKGEMLIKLYEYQERLLDCFQNNKAVILCSPRQAGKALDLNTPIMTPNGFKKMGDLNVGDFIYGKDGKKTKITFITETMVNREVYDVAFDNDDVIRADADHLWTINIGGIKGTKTLTTVELLKLKEKCNDQPRPPSIYINYTKPLDFEHKELPISPYVLGLWIGDGSTRDGRITCSSDDYIFYKEKFKEYGYEVSEFRLDKRTQITGNFNVVGLSHKLTLLGMKKGKFIPDEYVFNSIENRLDFIRGLMDSDGYCNTRGSCQFYQSDELIIDKVRTILSSLGIKNTKNIKQTTHKDAHSLSFCTQQKVFHLPRKLDRQKLMKNNPKNTRIYLSSIEKTKSVPVRCLQVDNSDHLFLCGETLIPTHNTTCTCIYLLWYALFNSKKEIAILANKQNTAVDILDDIKKGYEMLPAWMKPGIQVYNKLDIIFENGTKIFAAATSEDSLRGHSCSKIFLDEFAHITSNITDKFWPSTLPVISTGGSIIVVSTPNGATGKFYELYKEAESGKNGFKSFTINWDEVPGRDEAWKETMIKQMGKLAFYQEFANSFTGSSMTLIEGDVLARMKTREVEAPYQPDRFYSIWKKYVPGRVYAFGIDTAQGAGSDYSVVMIFDITTYPIDQKYELVAMYRRNDANIFNFTKEVLHLTSVWGEPVIICENNETGLGNILCTQLYMEDGYERVYYDMESGKYGITANSKTKKLATTYFKEDVESNRCNIHSKVVINELGMFEEREGAHGMFAARKGRGFNDDTVAGCYWLSYLLKSRWFEDMVDEIYKDPGQRMTSLIKDEEKMDEEQLDTFNHVFGQNHDDTDDEFRKELWR
jgi:hypothetical protein